MESKLRYSGIRSTQQNGSSIVISAPKRELEDLIGSDPLEHVGENVKVHLTEDGVLKVDLSDLGD